MASFPSGYLPMAMILGFSARRKQRLKHDTTKNATPTRSALTSRRRSAKMNVGRRKAKKQIPRTLLCAKSAVMGTAFWRSTTTAGRGELARDDSEGVNRRPKKKEGL